MTNRNDDIDDNSDVTQTSVRDESRDVTFHVRNLGSE
jgi:hypothetical protein